MAKVIVLGGGVCGLAAGLMLARDGHRVTVLERDPAPPPETPEDAWERWQRGGVAQFRQTHYIHARARAVLEAELPDVFGALVAAGGVRIDPLARMPRPIEDRSPRPGDDRLATVTARRTTVEQVLARAAERQPGLDVRRGVAAARLDVRARAGALHVAGVWTEAGDRLTGDLVVDAMGRRSRLPALLAEAGGPRVEEDAEDSGFIYYTRFFRSADGATPVPRAPLITQFPSFSLLTAPADAGTWSITIYAGSRDQVLKRLRHEDAFTALVRACPLQAHWLEGEPLTGVTPMGGVLDRIRRMPAGVTGIALLGDAWACTNPSLGRGVALGLVHGALLRALVREHALDSAAFAAAWEAETERRLVPWYRATVAADRARLAEMDAARLGVPVPVPEGPAARVAAALPIAMAYDADVYRAGMEITGCLTLPEEVFARPGFARRVLAVAGDRTLASWPGPGREELLELLSPPGARAAAA